MYRPSLRIDKIIRFQAQATATTAVITQRDLGDFLCMATGATAAYQLISAFKINSVEMWGNTSAVGALGLTVSIDWAGTTAGTYGSSSKQSDTVLGVARVPHLFSKPPAKSQVAEWQPSLGSAQLFTIFLQAGGVIDVNVSIILRDDTGVQAVSAAVAGATVGQMYYRCLDSTSTNLLLPVSLPTI